MSAIKNSVWGELLREQSEDLKVEADGSGLQKLVETILEEEKRIISDPDNEAARFVAYEMQQYDAGDVTK